MGIAETRHRQRPGKTHVLRGRPLPMGSNQDLCRESNFKRKAVEKRTSKLSRLLQRTPRPEVMLNRRMPNGTYGGVRGEGTPPLLDSRYLPRSSRRCTVLQLISIFWTLRRCPCAVLQLISIFWTLRQCPCTVLQLISIFWTLRSRFPQKERGCIDPATI